MDRVATPTPSNYPAHHLAVKNKNIFGSEI
jgi:hypothetical protein